MISKKANDNQLINVEVCRSLCSCFLSIGYSFMKTQWNKYKGAVGDIIAHSLKDMAVKCDIWESLFVGGWILWDITMGQITSNWKRKL